MQVHKIQLERLEKFASYLYSQETPVKKIICPLALSHQIEGKTITIDANLLVWVFNFLPGAFGDQLNEYMPFVPINEDGVDLRIVNAVYSLFGMDNIGEYYRLFAINTYINENSNCIDIAENIYNYIKEHSNGQE